MRLVRSLLTLFVALALSFSSAPAAHAATTTITVTAQVVGVTGGSYFDFFHWNGSGWDPYLDDQTAPDGSYSQPVDLIAGDVYTVKAWVSGSFQYYGGLSARPTTPAQGFVATGSAINLGTFTLGTTYTLSGTVLDETGAGFGGATVKVFTASADPATDTPLFSGESTTGDLSNGDYGFQLPAGSYRVVASAPGYVSASTTGTITVASISLPDLSLALGQSSISGTVTLPGGAAAAGASVQVYRWVDGDWTLDRTLTTASDGGYEFSVTTKSTLALFAKAVGYIGAWSDGVAAQPADSTSPGAITAADGLAVPLQLSTGFGAVAGQSLSYCTAHTLASGDTYNEAKVTLDFAVDLYGSAHQDLFVTDRGLVYLADSSHRGDFSGSDPSALATWTGVPVIAPLWFDGDTSGAVPGSVTYGSSADGQSFCVRWNNLGHYGPIEDNPNTFQLALQSRTGASGRSSGDVDITFNYDQVLWDGSNSRAVGYTAGDATDGHYWVYDGSSTPGVITDSGSSPLITHSVGSDVPGRYVLEIHNALVSTDTPSISGSAVRGGTLTAQPGSWSPAPGSVSYQWFIGDAAATGATGSSWVVPSDAAYGAHISVSATAKRAGFTDVVSARSVAVPVVSPASTGRPSVSVVSGGAVTPGATLAASHGSWSPTPSAFTYQWWLGGSKVDGATGSTWVVPPFAEGKQISVVVGSSLDPASVSVPSTEVTVTGLTASVAPSIGGSAAPGATVLAQPGTWSPEPVTFSYQWLLNGSPVVGATGTRWTLPAGTASGGSISLRVTAHKDGYSDVTASAAAVKVLKVFSKKPAPTISGTVKVGSTLTAKAGTWSPKPSLGYQWYRNGVAIPGARKSKYKVQLADVGQKLSVHSVATRSGYLQTTKSSKATKTVPKVALKTSTPKVVGTTKVGSILAAKPGSWTSGATLRFAWYRSGKLISGASASTYQLQIADRAKTITVKVTGSKTGYTTVTKTSKATKKIA